MQNYGASKNQQRAANDEAKYGATKKHEQVQNLSDNCDKKKYKHNRWQNESGYGNEDKAGTRKQLGIDDNKRNNGEENAPIDLIRTTNSESACGKQR